MGTIVPVCLFLLLGGVKLSTCHPYGLIRKDISIKVSYTNIVTVSEMVAKLCSKSGNNFAPSPNTLYVHVFLPRFGKE